MILWIIPLLIFLAAGVTLFAHLSWWRGLAVAASFISLVMMLLFWRPNLVIGVLVDVGVIAALLVANWPSPFVLWA